MATQTGAKNSLDVVCAPGTEVEEFNFYYCMCPHTTVCVHILLYVSSYYYICVLILLYMCPHVGQSPGDRGPGTTDWYYAVCVIVTLVYERIVSVLTVCT